MRFFSRAVLAFLMKESTKRRQTQPGKLMAKSCSQPVNLPGAWPLLNPLNSFYRMSRTFCWGNFDRATLFSATPTDNNIRELKHTTTTTATRTSLNKRFKAGLHFDISISQHTQKQ